MATRRILVCSSLGLLTCIAVAGAAAIRVDPLVRSDQTVEMVGADRGATYVLVARMRSSEVVIHAALRSVYPTPLRPDAGRFEIEAWANKIGRDRLLDESSAPAWGRPPSDWSGSEETSRHLALATGWPWRCLTGSAQLPRSSGGAATSTRWALRLEGGLGRSRPQLPRLFPLRPLLAGLAGNTAVFALSWWLMLAGVAGARRLVRRARGCCPSCGYDVRDRTAGRCPECGAPVAGQEARSILAAEIAKYRERSYAELQALLENQESLTHRTDSTTYRLEFLAVWDDRPNGNLRVCGHIDDGGLRAVVPICDDFIIAPDGTFVGETAGDG